MIFFFDFCIVMMTTRSRSVRPMLQASRKALNKVIAVKPPGLHPINIPEKILNRGVSAQVAAAFFGGYPYGHRFTKHHLHEHLRKRKVPHITKLSNLPKNKILNMKLRLFPHLFPNSRKDYSEIMKAIMKPNLKDSKRKKEVTKKKKAKTLSASQKLVSLYSLSKRPARRKKIRARNSVLAGKSANF